MNTETLEKEHFGKGITYYHNQIEDKHYFGGFLNLAQNNIYLVFGEFCQRLNIKFSEKNPLQVLNNHFVQKELSYSDWERATDMLQEYLPVVGYLNLPVTHPRFDEFKLHNKEQAKRTYFVNTFTALLKTIKSLRNFYTHAYHEPIAIDGCVYDFINSTLLKVSQKVKSSKLKDDKTRHILKQGIEEELNVLIKLKKAELKEKKKTNPKVKTSDKDGIESAVYNSAFGDFLFKEGEKVLLKDRQKAAYPQNTDNPVQTPISQSGLVFLLSMFLNRKEVEQLKANLKGFKGKVGEIKPEEATLKKNSLKNMATHWIYSYLAFKGTKQRVKNTFDKETLLMQMVDELSKVPHEVYQNLSEHNKKEFWEDINEYLKENDAEVESLEKATVVHPVIRKRYENKFLYFAIRFLDEFANFPTLRFQVFAGQFLHDKREKNVGNTQLITHRMVKERINVFGKLRDVCKYKSDYFAPNQTEQIQQGWELFPNPSYSTVGNNIPIYINLKEYGKEGGGIALDTIEKAREKAHPTKPRENNKASKKELVDIIYANNKESIVNTEPTALLSINELPALLYELLVNKKTGAQIEQTLVKNIVERCNTIANFKAGDKHTHSQMSKNLLKSTQQQKYNINKLTEGIKEELKETNKKLELIERNQNQLEQKDPNKKPPRKYIFTTQELGQEATWLANDLKRFMPASAKKLWKGYHHSELQRYLAFYDRHKKDAQNLLFLNWNTQNNPYWGESIKKVFHESHSFDLFYKTYLNNRADILNGFLRAINTPKLFKKIKDEVFIVFKERLYTIQGTNELINELLAKPIAFPRGIFDNKPTFIKGQKFNDAPHLYAQWYQHCYTHQNNMQQFYDMTLDYCTNFDDYKKTDKEALKNEKNLTEAEKLKVFKIKQDYTIKKVKQQDLFVKLMVDRMFQDIFKQPVPVPLSEFYQTKAQRSQNQAIAIPQSKRESKDNSENILNKNFVWNQTVPISLFNGQVEEPEVKVKEIGKFRKLEKDSKTQQILKYNPTRKWRKLQLEDELENKPTSYERIRREKMLKLFHQLEWYILNSNGFNGSIHPKNLEYDGNPNFRTYLLNLLQKHNKAYDGIHLLQTKFEHITFEQITQAHPTVKKAYILIALRNCIAHNQLPNLNTYKLINQLYPNQSDSSYSAYFYDVAHNITLELKK